MPDPRFPSPPIGPNGLEGDDLDRAARVAYDASRAVHGEPSIERDFKTQIVEWRAIARDVARATRQLEPAMLPSIDRAAGTPHGAGPTVRTNVLVDGQVNAGLMASALLAIMKSAREGAFDADLHRQCAERAERVLLLVAASPMGEAIGLKGRMDA